MTSSLIIDAGVAIKCIVPNPQQEQYINLMSGWHQTGQELVAPSLWSYEVTSVLSKMVHFGHLSAESGREGVRLAQALGVQLIVPDQHLVLAAYNWTLKLKRAAAYDSFYLALAESLQCDLWTTDRRLHRAVGEDWVKMNDE